MNKDTQKAISEILDIVRQARINVGNTHAKLVLLDVEKAIQEKFYSTKNDSNVR